MKIKYAFISLICAASIVSCTSHKQDNDNSFELVKEEKILQQDSVSLAENIVQDTIKVKKINAVVNMDEWTIYKAETERKIAINEKNIKKIKNIPNASTNLYRKVTNLEKDNNDLLRQMDEYNEEVKLKWASFKVLTNHNLNLIEIGLKDLNVSNN